ncbi:unnamed protein product [Amoebophrya sp. A120]|nr:unnamed protein product [Amoebophrya sp. A120]|eukprot:GSA120T00019617001.1
MPSSPARPRAVAATSSAAALLAAPKQFKFEEFSAEQDQQLGKKRAKKQHREQQLPKQQAKKQESLLPAEDEDLFDAGREGKLNVEQQEELLSDFDDDECSSDASDEDSSSSSSAAAKNPVLDQWFSEENPSFGGKRDFVPGDSNKEEVVFEISDPTAAEELLNITSRHEYRKVGEAGSSSSSSGDRKDKKTENKNDWANHKLITGKKNIKMSARVFNQLLEHQIQATTWMLALLQENQGGILADEMGMGKTASICGYLHALRQSNIHSKHVLILAPKSVLPIWLDHAKWLLPEWKTVVEAADTDQIQTKKTRDRVAEITRSVSGGILIASYDQLVRNSPLFKYIAYDSALDDNVMNQHNQTEFRNASAFNKLETVEDKAFHNQPKVVVEVEEGGEENEEQGGTIGGRLVMRKKNEQKMKKRKLVTRKEWDLVVLDEGHVLKNPRTAKHSAVASIKAKQRIMCSGTPLQNKLTELHSLLSLVTEGAVVGSQADFNRRFRKPMEKGSLADSTEEEIEAKTKAAKRFKEEFLKSFVMRRKKDSIEKDIPTGFVKRELEYKAGKDLLEGHLSQEDPQLHGGGAGGKLNADATSGASASATSSSSAAVNSVVKMKVEVPSLDAKKTEILVWCPVVKDSIQEKMYKKALNTRDMRRLLRELQQQGEFGENWKNGNALAQIAKLKLLSNHAVLGLRKRDQKWNTELGPDDELDEDKLDQSPEGIVESSSKFQVILHLVQQWRKNREKFVIFSSSTQMLNLLEYAIFEPRNYNVLRLDGSTTSRERKDAIRSFQDEKTNRLINGMLLSTRAMGQGVTLTAASKCIIVDPDWNPTADEQAMDRIHRIGQDQDVEVFRLFTKSFIEEHMWCLQTMKRIITKSAFESEEQKRLIAQADLKKCFTLGREPAAHTYCELLAKDDGVAKSFATAKKSDETSLLKKCLLSNGNTVLDVIKNSPDDVDFGDLEEDGSDEEESEDEDSFLQQGAKKRRIGM